MQHYPFAMLISTDNDTPFVTHIPIIYNEKTGKLVAHIDKFNPQIASLKEGSKVTVVFKGPDTYISPSVYATTQLPTWNYIIVHIDGTISMINNPETAKDTMIAMTAFLEGDHPKYVLEKDNPRMEAAVQYIQAFEITMTRWEGKFKLSQDKNSKDQLLAKEELLKNSKPSDAVLIKKIYD